MPTLYRSRYVVVEHHVASGYVRVTRSAEALPHARAAQGEIDACARAVSAVEAAGTGVLFDWRLAPLSVDPELVALLVTGVEELGRRFARSAMLVSTQVGKLQSIRLNRTQANPPTTFDDETKALAFVTRR